MKICDPLLVSSPTIPRGTADSLTTQRNQSLSLREFIFNFQRAREPNRSWFSWPSQISQPLLGETRDLRGLDILPCPLTPRQASLFCVPELFGFAAPGGASQGTLRPIRESTISVRLSRTFFGGLRDSVSGDPEVVLEGEAMIPRKACNRQHFRMLFSCSTVESAMITALWRGEWLPRSHLL
jgi:hypothetical protein